jgi:hypothetical protein
MACYGLLAAQHLAEHAGEGSFSANDLAESVDEQQNIEMSGISYFIGHGCDRGIILRWPSTHRPVTQGGLSKETRRRSLLLKLVMDRTLSPDQIAAAQSKATKWFAEHQN